MSQLMLAFHPLESFDKRLSELVEEFTREWERHWGLSPDHEVRDQSVKDEQEIRTLYGTADRLVRAAEQMSPARLPEDRRTLPDWLEAEAESERRSAAEYLEGLQAELPSEILDHPTFWRGLVRKMREAGSPAQQRELFFRTAVELSVFQRFMSMPSAMATRCIRLLAFLVGTKSVRAREYLSRVSRCYILGLRPELSIMCRAVMEAALEDCELDPGVVDTVLRGQGRRYPSLSTLILAAVQDGLLDELGRAAATHVQNAGNDVVHSAPGQAPDELLVLRNLKTVLEQIDAGPGRRLT